MTASAKVSPEEAARLGKDLTCTGAQKAGNADGTIPEFTGKYLGQVPGWKHAKHSGQHPVDPYAAEKPLFVITAANMAQYEARLTDGQKAMLKKFPATYRIPVYPGHRDYRYPDYVCERAKKNALNAELVDGGLGLGPKTIGQVPFPVPKSGQEVLWNQMLPARAWTEFSVADSVLVLPNGTMAKGRGELHVLSLANDPNRETLASSRVQSLVRNIVMLPDYQKGEDTVTHDGFNYKTTPRVGWMYNPGTRRVRQIPGTGFDQPYPGTNGAVTVDDFALFNGSPERFDWKNLGKREVYIPANAYRINGANVKLAGLLTPGHENPDYMRYELRRVWVLEGTLKPEYRHVYGKRVLYIDEDTWQAVIADAYDTRGQLWKHNYANYYYHPDMSAWAMGASFYHDLDSGKYTAFYLTNESKKAPILNEGKYTEDMFTADTIRSAGR